MTRLGDRRRELDPTAIAVLGMIGQGYTYEQILASSPGLTYLDIFAAARSALEITEKRTSTYAERLKKIRQVYPRAYDKWTDEEEEALKSLVSTGQNTEEIAEALQRQPGAITSRINKLGPG